MSKLKLKSENLNKSTDKERIVFSFALLDDKQFGIDGLDLEHAKAFLETLNKLSNLTWEQIKKSNRHASGKEEIPQNQLNVSIPPALKDKKIEMFRYKGKLPFAGYRDGQVFYVLCFDKNFRLYNHN